jgi:hypothetical protein
MTSPREKENESLRLHDLRGSPEWFLPPLPWTFVEPLLTYVESIADGDISFPAHIKRDDKQEFQHCVESQLPMS